MKKFELPKTLNGPRLRLVRLSIGMEEEIYKRLDASRERLLEFLPWPDETKKPAHVLKFINGELRKMKKFQAFTYAIKLRRKIIGLIGTHDINWSHARSEIGYWLATEQSGHGYMTEAVHILEASLFERGFNRITILCDTDNKRSAAVAERAGYHFEARFKEKTLRRDQYRSEFQFAKVRSEWIRQK